MRNARSLTPIDAQCMCHRCMCADACAPICVIEGEYCTLHIPMARQPLTYIVKYYIFDNFFMLAGVLSLYLNPDSPPLVGARCSIIILCMLLIVSMLQRDLGIGQVSYLTIIDIQVPPPSLPLPLPLSSSPGYAPRLLYLPSNLPANLGGCTHMWFKRPHIC